MLYRICDQLVILVRFRHLNGNLKLAGSGNGIDLWGVSWVYTTLAVSGRWGWFTGTSHGGAWLDRGNRIDLSGHAMGRTSLAGSGRWDWIMGYVTLAESGRWNCLMGTCNTGWSGAIGLIYGGVRHWLNRVMGLIQGGLPWGHTTLAGSGWWDRFMGVCRGACNTGWIGAMRLIYGIHHGAHNWIGEMGLIWGGTPLECDTGWDTSWGRDWIKEMGLICGDTTWGATLAGCEWWDWFMGVFQWGAQLDRGDEIDLWRRTMGAHDTG